MIQDDALRALFPTVDPDPGSIARVRQGLLRHFAATDTSEVSPSEALAEEPSYVGPSADGAPTGRRRSRARHRFTAVAAGFVLIVAAAGLYLAARTDHSVPAVASYPSGASCQTRVPGEAGGVSGRALAGPSGDDLCVGVTNIHRNPSEAVFGAGSVSNPGWVGPSIVFDICAMTVGTERTTARTALGAEIVYFGVTQDGVHTVVLRDSSGIEHRARTAKVAATMYALRLPDVGELVDVGWLDADGNQVSQGPLPDECADPARRAELQAARQLGWTQTSAYRFDPSTTTVDRDDEVSGWALLETDSFDAVKNSIDVDSFGAQRLPIYDEPDGTLLGYSYRVLGLVDPDLADSGTFDEIAIVTDAIGCYPSSPELSSEESMRCEEEAQAHFSR